VIFYHVSSNQLADLFAMIEIVALATVKTSWTF